MTKRQPWQHKRQSPSARGYDTTHRRLRKQLLAAEPLCRVCRNKGRGPVVATICDHIIPLAKGGPTTLENLQPLCAQCSYEKTLADQGKRHKVRIALDGWPEE